MQTPMLAPKIKIKKERPLNCYNLYYALEREYLLEVEYGILPDSIEITTSNFSDYADLPIKHFPPLPARYANLQIAEDWFVPKKLKRKGSKTCGPLHMVEMSKAISSRWKKVDIDTKGYFNLVAKIIMTRRDELPLRKSMDALAYAQIQMMNLRSERLNVEMAMLNAQRTRAMILQYSSASRASGIFGHYPHSNGEIVPFLNGINYQAHRDRALYNAWMVQRDNSSHGVAQQASRMLEWQRQFGDNL